MAFLRFSNIYTFLTLLALSLSSLTQAAENTESSAPGNYVQKVPTCKNFPGTLTWPTLVDWRALNVSLTSSKSGNLIKTIPLGAVCYPGGFDGIKTYDAERCNDLVNGTFTSWLGQDVHFSDPSSVLWPIWTNDTCGPTSSPSSPCSLGTYPAYVANVTSAVGVQRAVNFATKFNLRVIIKNTGHDFMGKSTGAGSLSIWTHHLKGWEVIEKYNNPKSTYKGGAVRMGSAWQTGEIYRKLAAIGKVLVGGECSGVGYSGGYFQGGGHGPLTPLYGLGSDQVLEVTLVTADGKHLRASASENSDLFWALRGGGGSTWGVVTSVTTKTYPDFKVLSAAVLGFTNSNETNSDDVFWDGVRAWHDFTPKLIQNGMYGYYEIFPGSMRIPPILAPGKTKEDMAAILAPLFEKWDALGLVYTRNTTEWGSFLSVYEGIFEGEGAGRWMYTGSRYLQPKHFTTEKKSQNLNALIREMSASGLVIIGHVVGPPPGKKPEGSAHPAWKDTVLVPLFNISPVNNPPTRAEKDDLLDKLNNYWGPKWKRIAPDTGAYGNEANPYDVDWQKDFYGANYPTLLKLKKKWDTRGLFYAKSGVGSEFWEELPNGRLCMRQ